MCVPTQGSILKRCYTFWISFSILGGSLEGVGGRLLVQYSLELIKSWVMVPLILYQLDRHYLWWPYNSHQLTHTTQDLHTYKDLAQSSVMCATINPWELVAISDSVAFLRSTSPVCPPFLPQLLSLSLVCLSHAVLNNCGNAYTTTHPATTSWGHFVGTKPIATHAWRQFKDVASFSYLP